MKKADIRWCSRPAGLILGLLLAGGVAAASSRAQGSGTPVVPPRALDPRWDPSKLSFPPLGTLPEVKAERFVLENGLIIYIVRDPELPIIEGNILIRAGGEYDPPDKVGLSSLTAQVLRTGGTLDVPGDSLDSYLESVGANIEVTSEISSSTVTFDCLKEQGSTLLRLLSALLREPAFSPEKLELARMAAHRSIASRNDDPGSLAVRLYRQLVWGKDHPYQRNTEYSTVDAISQDDLRAFHQRYYVPDRSIMTIWGDLEVTAMKGELTQLFGGLARSSAPLPPEPSVPAEDAGGGIYLADRPQMTQSYVYLAQVGIRADSPDYAAMEVMGELLGGAFTSRIVQHIRTLRGLAYNAGSGAGVGFAFPGTFSAYALTRSDSTLVTLGLLRHELDEIVSRPPSDEEVRRARESLLNSFVFNFSNPGQVASRQAFYEFYGYPADFLRAYQERLRKVEAADVQRVAQTHLHPPGMKVVVVGTESTFAQPLSTLGPVTKVDLTIPGAPAGPAGRTSGGGGNPPK